ncbi:TraR/DksA family transcriptional regulator [Yersinia enterocolitica]|nr:TraR/DksA family transcriptional regulator [Yersinia enterocolitica]NIL01070.1 TraR/DksA family transcriptional regulator [Yersinia aleksiciae]HDL6699443.1 TraR/DksA family transcriptional regulator [Yersinia enterocolitica]HDL8252478.1 TraR/DksA family transcriptional regulator [Yersinia enterocolitica]HEN3337996.1 TraR/DksA family transcriptional regulator [Yersinia enterocolitica]
MMDDFDRASDIEINDRQRALNAHLNRVKDAPIEYGFCNDCGENIPPQRLALDAVRCVTCQQIKELKEAQHGVGVYKK